MKPDKKQLAEMILELIKANPSSDKELFNIVRAYSGKLKLQPPEKSSLIAAYRQLAKTKKIKSNKKLEQLMIKRAVRTLSGVAVISVLTKPADCPGQCLFCPTEKGMPKSYLSNEPAVRRAILNDFDPYRQITMRLKALQANGHQTDKIELIVMGGTWSAHPRQYQTWFIKRCFEALNGRPAANLKIAQQQNETAKHRCIGLTLETRPDFIDEKEIKRLRQLGCTRVELGVQHTSDRILKMNRRGQTAEQSVRAIKLLKDAGFKINLHLMPNLYGSTPAKDLAMFQKIYTDGDYMPDMVKIYPCVVNEHADLYKLYRQKKYRPYTQKQLIDLIVKIKKITPPWVRITRLIRDIPEESIVAGNKTTNLRQLIAQQAQKDGWTCQCLRCREAGHGNELPARIATPASNASRSDASWQSVAGGRIMNYELRIKEYQASGGQEYFLSYESEDEKTLYAFLRLRLNDDPEKNSLPELRGCALIRELHTYGQALEIGGRGQVQHLGLGKGLLQAAEKIAQENELKKIAVIAGIGVRQYYQKFGYKLIGSYMIKIL